VLGAGDVADGDDPGGTVVGCAGGGTADWLGGGADAVALPGTGVVAADGVRVAGRVTEPAVGVATWLGLAGGRTALVVPGAAGTTTAGGLPGPGSWPPGDEVRAASAPPVMARQATADASGSHKRRAARSRGGWSSSRGGAAGSMPGYAPPGVPGSA